jgi:putative transposase
VSENPIKQGRKRPWVRFERENAAVTVHMDWYQNDRGQQVLAVEDDASRRVFGIIETDSSSTVQSRSWRSSLTTDRNSSIPARMIGHVSITSSNGSPRQ